VNQKIVSWWRVPSIAGERVVVVVPSISSYTGPQPTMDQSVLLPVINCRLVFLNCSRSNREGRRYDV
jgi:hypothetical protein